MAELGLAEPEHAIAAERGAGAARRGPAPGRRPDLRRDDDVRDVETPPLVGELAPGPGQAAAPVATVRIRNQATAGGNLVHADPSQDLPPMLMVREAVARLRGPDGVREVPATELFVGFFETVLDGAGILESVHVPAPAGQGTGYLEFLPRTPDDYPTVSVAAGVTVVDGRSTDARLAVAGGGSTTVRCRAAEGTLVDADTGEAALAAAADAPAGELDPVSDTGTVIDPVSHRGQLEGGFAFGLGAALMEELLVEGGRVLVGGLGDYELPTAPDLPPVTVVIAADREGAGPFGAKAVGVFGNLGVAPAIGNAVARAVGVHLQELPRTAEKGWAAPHDAP